MVIMSRKSKPLKVVVVNPPSEEHAKELIDHINEMFKVKYSNTKKWDETQIIKKQG